MLEVMFPCFFFSENGMENGLAIQGQGNWEREN
jgi:hypothetical protein